jgi:AcrR family transcriptional regulator
VAKKRDPELHARRREQIVATAMICLVEGSHRSMTLEQVARLAGVSKGMLTYYFKSKDELVLETIRYALAMQADQLQHVAREDRPVRERLERLLTLALPSRDEVEREWRFGIEVWSYAKEHPETMDAVRESFRSFRDACRTVLDVGVAEGFVTAPDAEQLYVLMHALVDGVCFQLVVDPELDLDGLRARIVLLIETLLAGAG